MTEVHIAPTEGGGYTAVVDGIRLPIASYCAEPGERGQLLVSLIVSADTLQIGVPPSRPAPPERRNEPPVSTWGDPNLPDPRANIPGWQPPSEHVDAHRGRTGEHRMPRDWALAVNRLARGGRFA